MVARQHNMEAFCYTSGSAISPPNPVRIKPDRKGVASLWSLSRQAAETENSKDASERIDLNATIKYPDGKRVGQVLYPGATYTAVRGVASL
jgi:hypothetical protein